MSKGVTDFEWKSADSARKHDLEITCMLPGVQVI